jgi:hypothetical protein
MAQDFWASDVSAEPLERTPYMILREQAAALANRTKEVIRAEVESKQIAERVEYELLIYASVLGLRVSIVRVVSLAGKPYPATLSGPYVKNLVSCRNEEAFTRHLKSVLGSKAVTETVQHLYADSRVSGLQFFLVEDAEVVGETGSLSAAKELASRMIGPEGWIDIHELARGLVGYYAWPEGREEPIYTATNIPLQGTSTEGDARTGAG